MFEMICLFGYTLNIIYAFETTWTQLIAFYVGLSFFWGDTPNSPRTVSDNSLYLA